jgi:hypothetical protein
MDSPLEMNKQDSIREMNKKLVDRGFVKKAKGKHPDLTKLLVDCKRAAVKLQAW